MVEIIETEPPEVEEVVEKKEKRPEDINRFFKGMVKLVQKNSSKYAYETCVAIVSQLKFGEPPKDYFNPHRKFKKWH